MQDESSHLFDDAMRLPAKKRAELAAALLRSLDDASDEGVDEAWAAELERRVRLAETGKSTSASWDAVREAARARLNSR